MALTRTFKVEDMIDVANPERVEVLTNHDATTLWINIDGVCALRVGHIQKGKLKFNLEHLVSVIEEVNNG